MWLHRSSRRCEPSGLAVFGIPFTDGTILKGAYCAEKYPLPMPVGELSARNGGKTCPGTAFSMATTLPIFGAMLPRAAAGLRPICDQVCASECTSAQACMDRTRQTSPSCAPILGISPVGQFNPLIIVGLKSVGVTPFNTLRSKVSVWLGAPASRMKMTFLALFCVTTLDCVLTSALATLPTR